MSDARVTVNRKPLEAFGLVPINLEEWLSAPSVTYGTVVPAGRMGSIATVAGASYAPRPLMLGVRTNSATTDEEARAILDAWYLHCQGMLEICIQDDPSKVCYGLFEASAGGVEGIKLLSPKLTTIGKITCHDPFWYRPAPTSFGAAAGTRVVVPVGSATSRLHLAIAGPYTDPILILRNRSGTEIDRMPFTDTAADSSIFLDLDFDRQQLDRYVAGVRSAPNNAYELLDPEHSFFVVDPLDGATLEVTSGGLTGLAWEAFLV
jgi:hypothetical protein